MLWLRGKPNVGIESPTLIISPTRLHENGIIRMQLTKALNAWNTPAFDAVLKQEIECMDGKFLPLQQGLLHSSYANEQGFSVSILRVSHDDALIRVKAGIFYTGMIPGCSCADDPTPDDEYNEYCVVVFEIDRKNGKTRINLVAD